MHQKKAEVTMSKEMTLCGRINIDMAIAFYS